MCIARVSLQITATLICGRCLKFRQASFANPAGRGETVVKSSDVQVRVFTLAAGEVIPWHYHRESTDHYFVLEGILSISSREPDVMARNLPVGSSHEIAPGRPHLITNGGDADCRFLLVQGVGAYDWKAAD
jgi:quercetin dioxygenase-like cupin family protein